MHNLFIHPTIHPIIHLSTHASTHPYIHPMTHFSFIHLLLIFHTSISLSIPQLTIHPSTHPIIHLSIHRPVLHPSYDSFSSIHLLPIHYTCINHQLMHHLSIHPTIHPSSNNPLTIKPLIYQCIHHLTIYLSIHPSSSHPSINPSVQPVTHPSIRLPIPPFFPLSFLHSYSPSICPSA